METAAEADPDTSGGSSNLFEDDPVRFVVRTTTEGVESTARSSGEVVEMLEEHLEENIYGQADLVAVEEVQEDATTDNEPEAMFINQPTINMEIDLARIQQPGFLSPVVILNSSLMVEPVPEAQATIEILHETDEDQGGEDEASRAASAAATAAMMDGPIVLIEDTIRMGGHGHEPQAGPSTNRSLPDTPRSREY